MASIVDNGDDWHINSISSVHARNAKAFVGMAKDAGAVIYADTVRASAFFRQHGVQFPKQESLTGSSPKMLTKDDLVNTVRFNQGRNAEARGRITFGDRTTIQFFEGAKVSATKSIRVRGPVGRNTEIAVP